MQIMLEQKYTISVERKLFKKVAKSNRSRYVCIVVIGHTELGPETG